MISANNYKDLTEDEMWELFDKIDLDKEVDNNLEQTQSNDNEEEEQSYLCSNCHSDSLVNDPSKGYYVCNKSY